MPKTIDLEITRIVFQDIRPLSRRRIAMVEVLARILWDGARPYYVGTRLPGPWEFLLVKLPKVLWITCVFFAYHFGQLFLRDVGVSKLRIE